jgi:glycosyltransferase involved in cell wall biosynthesis
MGKALQDHVGDVDFVGPVVFPKSLLFALRVIAKVTRFITGKEYASKYSFLVARYSGRFFTRKLKTKSYDVIVAPAASAELAFLKTSIPIVYISDATFHLLVDAYKNDFGKIAGYSRREGASLERRALTKSQHIIYPSYWAVNSAIQDYGIPPERISMVPLGANMDIIPDRNNVMEKLKNEQLTLLFLAVEWERKGGPIAFETLLALHTQGVNAKLIVCGCVPPSTFRHPSMEVIPFLNKNNVKDYDMFVNLLHRSHFLILPTRADCSLLVASESNAYGMPAIATNTGGVNDVVKDGVNGYCLALTAGGREYAELIWQIFSDKPRYEKLIRSSRQQFENHLNWNAWASSFQRIYQRYFLENR